MTDLTTLLLSEQRRVARDAYHPARAMAYELALSKRLAGHPHWWSWRSPSWLTAGQGGRAQGRRHPVARMTPCEPDC